MSGKGNDFWDDPEWDSLRRRVNKEPEPKKIPKSHPDDYNQQNLSKKVEVSVNFSVPKLKLPKITKKHRKIGLAIAIACVSVVGAIVVLNIAKSPSNTGGTTANGTNVPDFKTILPNGKTEETSSGKLGYDPERKVASFTDTIDLVDVTVSQQPLPEAFKTDPQGELKKLAEQISANEEIKNSSPNAYLGTSAKGPQTVVFVKNNLLIFIHSSRSIDKPGWAEYITRLR